MSNALEKAYNDGYKTGINWKDSWFPGGPFFCDDETKKINDTWKDGFF